MPKHPDTRRPRRRRTAGANRIDEASVTTVGPDDNIFEALGLPNPGVALVKAELACAIQREVDARGLTQTAAGAAMGGVQSDISNLARGRLSGYSIERLCRFLNALGQDVHVVVQPKPRARPQATVRATIRRSA